MTDTPNNSAPNTGGGAAAPTQSNSPFAQPAVPAPSGGDKSPVRAPTAREAQAARPRPTAMELARMTPQERWRANQPPAPPVITNAEREAAHREGRAPVPVDDAAAAQIDPAAAEKVKVGDFEMTKADLAQLVADKATRDSIRATLPTPDAYAIELPKDFKAPEGISFELHKDDPAFVQGRQFCFDNGLSQEAFSKLTGIYAGLEAAKVLQFENYKKAEIAKLGSAASERITAITTWMRAMVGPDVEGLARSLDYAPSEKTVVAFEKLMQKWSSQGAAGFRSGAREQPRQGVDDAQWDSMSYSQRREYTRNANARDGRR